MRHQRYFNRVNTRAWTAQEFMQRIGRTPAQQQYYNRDGSVKQGYSTVPGQQNSNPVFTHKGYNSASQNVYKMDTPQAAPPPPPPPAATNTTASSSYTPTQIDVGQGSFIKQYVDSGSSTHAGLAAVQRAEAAGMSIQDILNAAASQGFQFASGARNYLDSKRSTPTPTPTVDTSRYDAIIRDLNTHISGITTAMQAQTSNFNNQMMKYSKRFDEQAATYDKNLTSMRNTLIAGNTPQREPVLGIKGAADKSNAAIKQLGRQGMKGTFSREGLRIKNINL